MTLTDDLKKSLVRHLRLARECPPLLRVAVDLHMRGVTSDEFDRWLDPAVNTAQHVGVLEHMRQLEAGVRPIRNTLRQLSDGVIDGRPRDFLKAGARHDGPRTRG